MSRKRAKTTSQPSGREHWDEDLYSSVTANAEDVFYSGSDDEDYGSPAERKQRLIAAAQRFLQHGKPYIMTSSLSGPFEASSGWVNPWCSTRQKIGGRVKPARTTPVETPAASSQQRITREKKAIGAHLPTPESLNGTHIIFSEPLSSNSQIKKWQNTVVPPNTANSLLSASPSISHDRPSKRKPDPESMLWERRKRSKPLDEASKELDTTTIMQGRPQSSHRTRGILHSKDYSICRETEDSNDELMAISPSPFYSQNSNRARMSSTSSKRSPVNEFFASRLNGSEDELGITTSGSRKPNIPCTPTASEASTPLETITPHVPYPRSEAGSAVGLDDTSTSRDDSKIAERLTTKNNTPSYSTTPKTPTRQSQFDTEDDSSSDEEDMSVISDSGMRALSVELNGHDEETKSPRRSSRLRADVVTLPSITVSTLPDAESSTENSDSEAMTDPATTESDSEILVDIEMQGGTSSETSSKSLSSKDSESPCSVNEDEKQPMLGSRKALAPLDTNQLNKPVDSPEAAERSDLSALSERETPHASFGATSPEHKVNQRGPGRLLPEFPPGLASFSMSQSPRVVVWKTAVRTPDATTPPPRMQRAHESESYIPTFASFMSPSPQRARRQRAPAGKRPRKTVSWAPLPDGKEDDISSESNASLSPDKLFASDGLERPARCGGPSQAPRRMASPPPDTEALDSALQEGQNLGQLFSTLNTKDRTGQRSHICMESSTNELPATLVSVEKEGPSNKEVLDYHELGPAMVTTLPSDEDAWLDMVMDSVGTELTTHAWDNTEADQADRDVAAGTYD